MNGDEEDDISSGPSDIENAHEGLDSDEYDDDDESDDGDDASSVGDDEDNGEAEEADASNPVGVTSGRFGALSLGDDDKSVDDADVIQDETQA